MRSMASSIPTYLVIGAICIALNNAILIGGDLLGFHYAATVLVCYVLVGAFAFLCHARLTFGRAPTWHGYARFQATQGAGTLVTLAILFLASDVVGLPMWFAAPIATLVMVAYNFLSTRWAVSTSPYASRHVVRSTKPFSRRP